MPEVRTIQGLNLESQYTTVKIELEGNSFEEVNKLLDKIAAFHPIFIKEYILSPNLLTVRSKLPFVWRESAEYINRLSKDEVTYQEADAFVIDTVIAKRVKSMSTIPILQAAHDLNIESIPAILDEVSLKDMTAGYSNTFNRYYVLGCGRGSQITCSISSSKDAHIAQKTQRDKWSTNTMIQRLNLPMPKWNVIDTEKELEEIWDEYTKPVVIKPTGLTGGKGVSVNISTLEKAKKAFKYALDELNSKERAPWQRKIMIQEQVEGDDYRLLVINGKLEIATKRIPAFVIGDGKHTIEELIDETNKDPRRDISNPAHILKPIVIDQPLIDLLEDQKLTLKSIPKKDQIVPVRRVASMSQGGVTEDFTDVVGKEIRIIVESLAESLHAFTLGVDVMCKDISKPLTKENGAILEVNTMPEAYLNFFPTIGTQREYVAETYVKGLLSANFCKKFVVIGQSTDDIPTLLRRKNIVGNSIIDENATVGEIKDNEYLINGREINENIEHWRAVEAIKCNASLDVIILHYRDWKEVGEKGLGFDHINTLLVTREQSSNRENMNIIKKFKRMKLIDNIKVI